MSINDAGDVVLRLEGGEVRQQCALVSQESAEGKREARARYELGADGEVGVALDDVEIRGEHR